MTIGDTIDITLRNSKTPLYRMEITKVSEHGFHGFYKCCFDGKWGDWISGFHEQEKGIGLITFGEIGKVEIID